MLCQVLLITCNKNSVRPLIFASLHWIVNVQAMQILAFAITPDGTIRRLRESQVLPGLKLEILDG